MAFKPLQSEQSSTEPEVLTPGDFGGNYGDVALNLPPDWSRTQLSGAPEFMLTAIGHDRGIPDLYRTDNRKARHQFRWIAPDDRNQVSVARTRHYEIVSRNDWTKNDQLWEWDGEGHVIHNGQLAWARPESYYLADKEQEDRMRDQRNSKPIDADTDRSERTIEKRGGIIYDERGRPLTPLSNK